MSPQSDELTTTTSIEEDEHKISDFEEEKDGFENYVYHLSLEDMVMKFPANYLEPVTAELRNIYEKKLRLPSSHLYGHWNTKRSYQSKVSIERSRSSFSLASRQHIMSYGTNWYHLSTLNPNYIS